MASGSIDLGANTGNVATNLTQGSVVFAGASGVLSQDNANLFWDDTNNFLGIGTSTPTSKLHLTNTITSTSASRLQSAFVSASIAPSGITAGNRNGLLVDVSIPSGNTQQLTNALIGIEQVATNAGTGTVGGIAGFVAQGINTGNANITSYLEGGSFISQNSAGTVAYMAGTDIEALATGGTITTQDGIYLYNDSSGATVTNRHSLYIDAPGGSATNDYALYSANTAQSYFAGNLGLGVIVPSYKLDVAGEIATRTAGQGFRIKEGSNARMGTGTLGGGTGVLVVSNTSVTANTRIFLTINTPGGVPGYVYVSTRTAGTSFTMQSVSAADTSAVAWLLVEPA